MDDIAKIVTETRLAGAGLWYLSTPYAKYPFGLEAAAVAASRIAAALLGNGVPVFSPIAHGHPIKTAWTIQSSITTDRLVEMDRLVMQGCVGLIVARMPGYHYSEGVKSEIAWFTRAGCPVLYLDVIDIIGLPEIFTQTMLAQEVEAKIMGEPQPVADGISPAYVGVDPAAPGSDRNVYWTQDPDGSYHEVAKPDPDPRENAEWRKARPIMTGAMDYFPLAIAEVARISQLGHDQHTYLHEIEDLHWERTLNSNHADSAARHLLDRGRFDRHNARHAAYAAWRVLALLQEELEGEFLEDGVHPTAAFAPASRWGGRTSEEFFSPVSGTGGLDSRQAWVTAATQFWDAYDYARPAADIAAEGKPVNQEESVQAHAARSIADMVREWFSGPNAWGPAEERLSSLIERRLKRFWHD